MSKVRLDENIAGQAIAVETRNDSIGQRDEAARRFPRLSLPWLVGIALCLVALGFNLYRLGNPSIWYDEAFSVELARQPLPMLWHIIWGPEPDMELYYLFLHCWLAITGFLGLNPTEFVVRLPSAIFASLSTGIVFMLGRRFLSTAAGVVGAIVYLLNGLQLTYAQQTRSYALQLFLVCLGWYALLAALTSSQRQKRWWITYVVVMTLAVYAQLFSAFILLAQLVTVVILLFVPNQWRGQVRKNALPFGICLVTTSILNIPMVLESTHGAKTGWLPSPHLHDLYQLFYAISEYNKLYLLTIVCVCVLGVGAVVAGYLTHTLSRQSEDASQSFQSHDIVLTAARWFPVTVALLCWLLVPTLVSYAVSQTSLRLFSSRYLVVVVPALCLLISPLFAVLKNRIMQVALAVCLILVAFSAVPLYYQSAQVEDWNSTAHWLIQRYQPGDGLVCYENQDCQISMEYYLHAYPGAAHFDANAPGAFSWSNFGSTNPATGYDAAVDSTALATYGAQHARIFFITGRIASAANAAKAQAAQKWLDQHYHFIAQIVTRTVTIRLYATT